MSLVSAVIRVARLKWPRNTPAAIEDITGVSTRQSERLVALRTGLSATTVASLLRSEHGFAFLEAIMEGDGYPVPPWWASVKYHAQAAQLEADLAEARQRLRDNRKLSNGPNARRT